MKYRIRATLGPLNVCDSRVPILYQSMYTMSQYLISSPIIQKLTQNSKVHQYFRSNITLNDIGKQNKTKVIHANILYLYFDFEDIIMFGNISVFVTFQFW